MSDAEKPVPGAPVTRSLGSVVRALEQQQTIAVLFEHLAAHVAVSFRGNESAAPTKLLRTLSGSARRAEIEDVLLVEEMLGQLAVTARERMARLQAARVIVSEEDAAPCPTEVPMQVGDEVVDRNRAAKVVPRAR